MTEQIKWQHRAEQAETDLVTARAEVARLKEQSAFLQGKLDDREQYVGWLRDVLKGIGRLRLPEDAIQGIVDVLKQTAKTDMEELRQRALARGQPSQTGGQG